MPALRPLVARCLTLTFALSWAPPANADPASKREVAQGRERAAKGLEHFTASHWAEARELFLQALGVQETAAVSYYLGVCEERLGNLLEARRRLERAEALALSGESSESAQTRRAVLEDAREVALQVDAKLAKVTFRWQPTRPEGATLAVDDEAVAAPPGRADEPLRLNPGEHKVRAAAPGKKTYVVALQLSHGERREVVLALESEAPPAPVMLARAAEPPAPPAGGWQRPVGYTGLGLGVALVGAGVFSSLRVSSEQDKLASEPGFVAYSRAVPRGSESCNSAAQGVEATSTPGAAAVTPAQFADACGARDRFHTLQYVFYGAGAAVALTGAYFAFLAPSGEPKARAAQQHPSWRFVPAAGPSAASVSWALTF